MILAPEDSADCRAGIGIATSVEIIPGSFDLLAGVPWRIEMKFISQIGGTPPTVPVITGNLPYLFIHIHNFAFLPILVSIVRSKLSDG